MNIIKRLAFALALAPLLIANSMADTAVTVQVTNYTSSLLKMKSLSTVPADYPLATYDVSPSSIRNLHFVFKRNFTYTTAGWQPSRRKVEPVRLILAYELEGYGCQLFTRLSAPVHFGVLEPRYVPDWVSSVKTSGDSKYTCKTEISRKMLEPPFSYTVNVSIDTKTP